ncbi:NUDIX hydrolase [Streptosporangium saharense]|uniref:ADP-ribose pyrophosphatase YjhB (NUDIX family) n=1 Tax=Streptosporangium saharense TaxID=1706840 RepID=A0A7W7VQU9_9ACTN|nr:NUDIX domain-containing protein [Streptosporangium saharense]MBB4919108.1 ADP-ribose pyrophosphatase YjhB (NUDIX family) [Streptosporangium saharense]
MTARRIDFYDDPAAPAPNSLVPSVNVVVVNDVGDILMIRRSDNGNWAVPGGAIDLGESLPQAAVRETLEETGVTCEITGLVGTYTDPKHVILYTSDGEARQEFSIVLTARPIDGEPTPSDESREVRWVPREEIGSLVMDRSMRLRLGHFLDGAGPYIG